MESNIINNTVSSERTLNIFQRYIGLIISPKKTIKNIIEKPKILFSCLIMMICSITPLLLTYNYSVEMTKKNVQAYFDKMHINATQIQFNKAVKQSLINSLINIPITTIVSWLIFSILIFSLIKMLNGQGTLKQILSLTSYTYIIKYLFILLPVVFYYFTGSVKLDLSIAVLYRASTSNINGIINTILSAFSISRILEYSAVFYGVSQLSKLDKNRMTIVVTLYSVVYICFCAMMSMVSNIGK